MDELGPKQEALTSDETSHSMCVGSFIQIPVQDSVHKSVYNPVQDSIHKSGYISTQDSVHESVCKSVQDSVQDSVQKSDKNVIQDSSQDSSQMADKLTWTRNWTSPFELSPIVTLSPKRLGGSKLGDPRPGENMPISQPLCTSSRSKNDEWSECEEIKQVSVYTISKPAYRDDDAEVEIGIRPYSSCSQIKSCSDAAEESTSFSFNQPDKSESVEIIVDPQLEKCNPKSTLTPTPTFTRFSRRGASCKKTAPTRNECGSLKQAVLRAGGVSVGAGAVPTVALAVPIMFSTGGMDPRLCVNPLLLAPSAENRRNHRLCSKFGQFSGQCSTQYTTKRFSRGRAKLTFVQDQKHACSKRRVAVLMSVLMFAVCCLAVITYFNTTLAGLFEDRGEDRAEELSLPPVGQDSALRLALAAWTPWTEWSGCAPGIAERSRSRQCRLANGTGHILTDIQPCVALSRADANVGDIEVDNCATVTTPPDTVPSTFISSQGTHDSIVVTETAVAATGPRHCDECVADEVCVALAREEVPECRAPLDVRDPTGCAGHCRLGVEMCRQLDRDAFRCLEQQHCFESEFRCANLLCIPGSKRCDGHNNCYDESDEYDCDCDLQTHFHCRNRTSCLPLNKRCDGVIDCWDGSDEANCTKACPGDEVMCASGSCVRRAYFCDGLRDCADGSDEPFGCGERCHRHELTCANGRCVSAHVKCDNQDDCGDATDELNCDILAENYTTQLTTNSMVHSTSHSTDYSPLIP